MTFRLFAIELVDFKAYAGTHEFEFPAEPGLYYLTGRNEYNPRLGANAAGKSSFIDAIIWCIYGKTSRGLRAGDVVSWGKKSCRVSVSLMVGEDEVEIIRSQRPNSLTINGKPSSQEEVSKFIRLNQEAFELAVILPQFGSSFFDLTPARKLEMFSQVMNLDYWLAKSKLADGKASIIANNMAIAEQGIAKVEGKIDSIRDSLKELKDKSSAFAIQVEDEIKAHRQDIKRQKRKGDEARAGLKAIAKKADGKDADIEEVKKELHAAADDFSAVEQQFLNLMSDQKTNGRHLIDLRDALSASERQRGTVCSKCKQAIDDKHIKKQQTQINKEIDKLEDDNASINASIKKLTDKRAKMRKDVLELNNLKTTLERELSDIVNEANGFKRDIKHTIEMIDSSEAAIKRLGEKENPFEAMIERNRTQVKRLKKQLVELNDDLKKLRADYEAYTYWVGGFKRVRLFVIEEALASLEIEVNNLLISLGLVDWKVTFDIEKENKSGSVTKGFSVFVHSPKHDKPVRFESWSGGETQRLRLAGDLGLANLIMEQAGLVSHIEMIDEPSEHMSQEGIEDLLETIHQRAENTNKQIWLVDHHSMEFAGFSGILTAVMDKKGRSSLEYGTEV